VKKKEPLSQYLTYKQKGNIFYSLWSKKKSFKFFAPILTFEISCLKKKYGDSKLFISTLKILLTMNYLSQYLLKRPIFCTTIFFTLQAQSNFKQAAVCLASLPRNCKFT